MKRIMLEDAKQLQYEMLMEVHRYCEENGLKYYLYAGTLLGAIRHQGYIPWDDDIDIIMPKTDFELFMKNYRSDRYEAVWPFNNKEHEFAFGRLFDKRTCHKYGRHKALGLFIDIYVIFGVTDDEEVRKEHFNTFAMYNKWTNRIGTTRRRLAKLYLWPFKTLKFTPLNTLCKKMYKELSKYDSETTTLIHTYGGGQIVVNRDLFKKRITVKFNDSFFYAPEGYDTFLRQVYGDYMKLPPEEQRHPYHGISKCYWK